MSWRLSLAMTNMTMMRNMNLRVLRGCDRCASSNPCAGSTDRVVTLLSVVASLSQANDWIAVVNTGSPTRTTWGDRQPTRQSLPCHPLVRVVAYADHHATTLKDRVTSFVQLSCSSPQRASRHHTRPVDDNGAGFITRAHCVRCTQAR